jgi:transposase
METLNITSFYPSSLRITDVSETEKQIIIKLKSLKHEGKCPKCGEAMRYYHGTYKRTVQDLPILGKQVILKISSYEYVCENPTCTVKSFVDEYDGFLSKYSRMTSRCEDIVRVLALETSCEGASEICRLMGIKTSGDTIIRMLKAMADDIPVSQCGETIGVDDFAYRKGQTYCTIVCDWETRRPIAVLDGRDGESLRKWLQENKHVKKVTRDRASAYAKVITEVLPESMQIADRFHLHQNLLKAVKEALKEGLPNKIAIPNITAVVEEDTVDLSIHQEFPQEQVHCSTEEYKKNY